MSKLTLEIDKHLFILQLLYYEATNHIYKTRIGIEAFCVLKI